MEKINIEIRNPKSIDGFNNWDFVRIATVLGNRSLFEWKNISFPEKTDVIRLLKLNGISPLNRFDQNYLNTIKNNSIRSLINLGFDNLDYEMLRTKNIDEILFMLGRPDLKSGESLCPFAKILHVVHRMEARTLKNISAISDERLSGFLNRKILGSVERMIECGYPITNIYGGIKSYQSQLAKMIAKTDGFSHPIFDKFRFRIIVKDLSDIPVLLCGLFDNVIPVNCYLSGQTVNSLFPIESLFEKSLNFNEDSFFKQQDNDKVVSPVNRSSSAGYKTLNFIADLPVKIHNLGTIFVLCEFQIIDEKTRKINSQGDNSHSEYKSRQLKRIRSRLS